MRYIPNIISLTRIPLAVAMVWLACRSHLWLPAFIVFAVALVTDVADGWLARKYGWESSVGEEVLEPLCDLFLSVAAIFALAWSGAWSWEVVVVIGIIAVILQLISLFGNRGPLMKRLKRHQYYLHPMFFVGVVILAFLAFQLQVTRSIPLMFISLVIIFIVIMLKRERAMKLLAGPSGFQ